MKKRYVVLLYALAFFLLIAGLIYLAGRDLTIEITQRQFEQMLREGEIQEVILVSNENLVEVTLDNEALQKPDYWNELVERNPFALSSGPQYHLIITNPDVFDASFFEAQRGLPKSEWVGYQVEERSGLGSLLLNWGFLFLLCALIFGTPIFIFVQAARKRNRSAELISHETGSSKTPQPEQSLINFPHKVGDRVVFTPINEIACFFAQDNHVYLYDVLGKEHLVEYTLADLEGKLPAQFIRVHRAYIINAHLIREVKKQPGSRFAIRMQDEQHKEIMSGQSYAAPVKQLLEI